MKPPASPPFSSHPAVCMKFLNALPALALTFALAGLTACGRNDPPPAIGLAAAPKLLNASFSSADEATRNAAAAAAAALQANNPGRAFATLQDLSSRSDLSPEQRQAAAQSLMAVGKELNEAAARGDAQARQILELHHASK